MTSWPMPAGSPIIRGNPPDLRKPPLRYPCFAAYRQGAKPSMVALRRYPASFKPAFGRLSFSLFFLGVFVVFAVVLSSRGFGRPLCVRFRCASRSEVARLLWAFRRFRSCWRRAPLRGSSAWVRGGWVFPRVGSLSWFAFFPCVVRVFALSPRVWLPAFAPSAVFSLPSPRVVRR